VIVESSKLLTVDKWFYPVCKAKQRAPEGAQ
jgi:hypothetical protein